MSRFIMKTVIVVISALLTTIGCYEIGLHYTDRYLNAFLDKEEP